MARNLALVIEPRAGWQPFDLREIWLYRELIAFLVWRDIKIRYRQTVLGAVWAVLQPLLAMFVFTIFFNRLGTMDSGGVPYPLFSFTGLVAWTFFANAVSASSNSLVGNQQLISKIYFPRIFIPLGSIGAFILDLALNIMLTLVLLILYRWPLTASAAWLPVFVLGTVLAASGSGLILSALNVQFRDIKYLVPFAVQMGLFLTPVIYPIANVPERYQLLLGLNPMAGMVEGFRLALLGAPARWDLIGLSMTVSAALFVAGLAIFRRLECRFADII